MSRSSNDSALFDLLERPEWHHRAACRGQDPNLFFPPNRADSGPALAICSVCSVRSRCAEAGKQEVHGVWGGTTAEERRRRQRAG